jgi:hypothetical protein
MFWYGLLEMFVKEHGHCRVPFSFETDDGYRLGGWVTKQRARRSEMASDRQVPRGYKSADGFELSNWVNFQRAKRDEMAPDRRQRLEALPGWTWDTRADQWEEGFSYLRQYSEREGNCRVPLKFEMDDGYRLGGWVSRQRTHQSSMDPDRR